MRPALLLLAAVLLTSRAAAQDIRDLRWLRGCWQTEAPREAESGATYTEVWISPEAPVLLGYAYHEGEGEIQGWSQMRIESNGRPEFVDMPLGSFPVRYRLVGEETDNRATFENLGHDFPKRIDYRREGSRLYLRISDGGEEGQDFAFHRIRCPLSLRP
jgi:hypothetical protein